MPRPAGSRPPPASTVRRTIRAPVEEVAKPTLRRPSGLGLPGVKILPAVRSVSAEQHVLEKEQAHAVRLAMEKMALQDEQRLMKDAGDEALRLMRQHETSQDNLASALTSVATRASPFTAPRVAPRPPGPPPALNETRSQSPPADYAPRARLPHKLSFSALVNRRRSSGTRRRASGRQASFSNPNDRIYEDPPVEATVTLPATATAPRTSNVPTPSLDSLTVRRNPFARAKSTRQSLLTSRPSPDQKPDEKPLHKMDALRNPPSRSRQADYMSNTNNSTTFKADEDIDIENADVVTVTRFKNGVEIRSDDIRAATSMKLMDRSDRLPCPTVTSDDSSRPIVSFSKNRTRPSVRRPAAAAEEETASRLRIHRHDGSPSEIKSSERIRNNEPVRPSPATTTAGLSLGIPQITINPLERDPLPVLGTDQDMDEDVGSGSVPIISITAVPDIRIDVPEATSTASSRLLHSAAPAPTQTQRTTSDAAQPLHHRQPHPTTKAPGIAFPSARPLPPRTSSLAPTTSSSSAFPQAPRPLPTPKLTHRHAAAPSSLHLPANLCAQCALPISGRLVSAASVRFHPACFTCHHCGIALEHAAFYPEPAARRATRLAKRRSCRGPERAGRGEDEGEEEQREAEERDEGEDDEEEEEEEQDDGLRFYCHLDYHEQFSPRCASCATPIEGEVVVACGREWHVGHFFCAQCGDVSLPSSPFLPPPCSLSPSPFSLHQHLASPPSCPPRAERCELRTARAERSKRKRASAESTWLTTNQKNNSPSMRKPRSSKPTITPGASRATRGARLPSAPVAGGPSSRTLVLTTGRPLRLRVARSGGKRWWC